MRRWGEARFGPGKPARTAAWLASGPVVVALLALAPAAAAAPSPEPYGSHDAGGFRNVLPPAQGRDVNSAEIAAFELSGDHPSHTQDQLAAYVNLAYATPGLKRSELPSFYKDATFGVKPGKVESTESPSNDVTIVRDDFGVPHIYGATRGGAMFGEGYATAEDRLFFMDALRHAGRAQLSSFAGGSNAGMDESVWADTPYNESELQLQYDRGDELYGQRGVQAQHDVQNYVAGVNQFIDEACANPARMPGEYDLIDPSQSICLPGHEWKVTDVISIASLVAGIFGKGGGGELQNALTLQAAEHRFGKRAGHRVYTDFLSPNDPEAPTTVHGKRFHYGQPPKHPRGLALPDRGTVQFADPTQPGGFAKSKRSASAPAGTGTAPSAGGRFPDLLEPLATHHSASNALLVSGRESKGGHPIAVMGPQVAYFSPQILMEQDVHAPGIGGPPMDARGAAFPGTNLYVQLGHGRNYAWSATSAGQDIIDTYAVRLCQPGGGTPTMHSDHYEFEGQCLPFDLLTRTNSWITTPADQSPPGTETLTTLRTKVGVVIARARIHGKPYAYTKLRDTYFHEVDPSSGGFADFNDPQKMRTPRKFMHSACEIAYTFNWFYVNRHHIAYFNSGQNPVRPKRVDPTLPTLAKRRFIWRNYDPSTETEATTPCRSHPHVVDQRYLTSWNNRQAPGYNVGYSSVYRSQMLDEQLRPRIAGSRKITLPKLVDAMEVAGSVDLRGDRVLPWALKVIGRRPAGDPALRRALHLLAAWRASGAHRIDRDQNGTYEHSKAIRIMDAWWPDLLKAEFKPTLGKRAFDSFEARVPFDDHNRVTRLGSAFQDGWYGYANKDLRTVLGRHVRGPYSRAYCGRGSLARCRHALLGSLRRALAHDRDSQLYPGGSCQLGTGTKEFAADPQACADAIGYRAVGAITQPLTPWINRPTFQQAVEIPRR